MNGVVALKAVLGTLAIVSLVSCASDSRRAAEESFASCREIIARFNIPDTPPYSPAELSSGKGFGVSTEGVTNELWKKTSAAKGSYLRWNCFLQVHSGPEPASLCARRVVPTATGALSPQELFAIRLKKDFRRPSQGRAAGDWRTVPVTVIGRYTGDSLSLNTRPHTDQWASIPVLEEAYICEEPERQKRGSQEGPR